MHTLLEHVASSEAFEQAVAENGWVLCRNEATVEEATMQVVAEIQRVLAGASGRK